MDQQEIFKEALAMQEELTTWRHALHQMPELSLDLPKTSASICQRPAPLCRRASPRWMCPFIRL